MEENQYGIRMNKLRYDNTQSLPLNIITLIKKKLVKTFFDYFGKQVRVGDIRKR